MVIRPGSCRGTWSCHLGRGDSSTDHRHTGAGMPRHSRSRQTGRRRGKQRGRPRRGGGSRARQQGRGGRRCHSRRRRRRRPGRTDPRQGMHSGSMGPRQGTAAGGARRSMDLCLGSCHGSLPRRVRMGGCSMHRRPGTAEWLARHSRDRPWGTWYGRRDCPGHSGARSRSCLWGSPEAGAAPLAQGGARRRGDPGAWARGAGGVLAP